MRKILVGLAALFLSAQLYAAPITIGQSSVFTSPDSNNANLLLAQHATLTQSAALQSISFYVTTAGGQLRLGLYSGTATAPTTLIAQTAAFTPVVGWNTQALTSGILPAGDYWLAYLPSSGALGFVKSTVDTGAKYYTFTFGQMPATFTTAFNSTDSQWSFYATLVPSTSPVTGAPSSPKVLFAPSPVPGALTFVWDPVTTYSNGSPASVTGYNFYLDAACPGNGFVFVPGATSFSVSLPMGSNHTGQVTAVTSLGEESPCSNSATGVAK